MDGDGRPPAAQATGDRTTCDRIGRVRRRIGGRRPRLGDPATRRAAPRRRGARPRPPRPTPGPGAALRPAAQARRRSRRAALRRARRRAALERSAASSTDRRSRSRRASTPRSSTRATSSARRSSGSGSATRRRRRSARSCSPATSAGRTRRSCATRPSSPTPTTSSSSRPTAAASTSRSDEAIRILAETVRLVAEHDGVLLVPSFAIGRTQEVVWELDRLDRARQDPAAAALPRLADGLEGVGHLPSPSRLLRRGDPDAARPPGHARSTTRTRSSRTTSGSHRRSPGRQRPYMIIASNGMLTGGRVVGHLRNLIDDPAAVAAVRRLPGRRHPRCASPGRGDDRSARRPDPPGAVPDPVDQRLLRPCGRVGAARLADELRDRQAARRPRLPAQGLPGPRRPGCAGGPAAEGPGPRLRHGDPASGTRRWSSSRSCP